MYRYHDYYENHSTIKINVLYRRICPVYIKSCSKDHNLFDDKCF